MTDAIPVTRIEVPTERADAIRKAVSQATAMPARDGMVYRLAQERDTAALLEFLSDPRVHAPIYSLPRPLHGDNVRSFINAHLAERALGTGLLFLNLIDDAIVGYSDIQVWPRWATGELAGAVHPDRQNAGEGKRGARASFSWMFDALGLERICETAARDNARTAALLDALGFTRMGEVTSRSPAGCMRPSRVWEVSRQDWQANG